MQDHSSHLQRQLQEAVAEVDALQSELDSQAGHLADAVHANEALQQEVLVRMLSIVARFGLLPLVDTHDVKASSARCWLASSMDWHAPVRMRSEPRRSHLVQAAQQGSHSSHASHLTADMEAQYKAELEELHAQLLAGQEEKARLSQAVRDSEAKR